jgi:sec-independent protein translocase protein TatA
MGEFSPIHWLIVLAIIVLLFGGKKIPEVMKGLGEGIRHFKDGMSGNVQTTQPVNPTPPAAPPVVVVPPAPAATDEKK